MAKFTMGTWNDGTGTSLQGYVTTTYAFLVEKLGKPLEGDDKVTAEWILKFEDGTVATIYDYKEYRTPKGVYDWHIGGQFTESDAEQSAPARIAEVLGIPTTEG